LGNLIPLSDRVWVLPGGVNIGVLRGAEGRVALIDTGLNETSAKKALKAVREELGGEVSTILTTHAHADHFGGNAAVVKRTGASVYAPAFDEAFLRYPLLQPASLFGGADPVDTLRGGFLLAAASPVDVVVTPGPHEIVGVDIEAVPLYGHSPGQLGYLIDDVFFCADVVLPESVLDKYRIPYLFSLSDHLTSLERAREMSFRTAAPGHGPLLDDLGPLIDLNLDLAQRVMAAVLDVAATPATAEVILGQLLQRFGADVADAPSFYLLQPTVFAYLSHLHRSGRLSHEVREGASLWRTV
jgi:glyoxylase-like metal-dependent hydrolase (beta-lactamase superfamily II)